MGLALEQATRDQAKRFAIDGGLLAVAHTGGLCVIVTRIRRWTTDGTLRFLDRTIESAEGDLAGATLVQHLGAHHDAAQRRLMVDRMKALRIPIKSRVAVLTEDPVLRAAVTAWRWISGADTAAFSPDRGSDAVRWLRTDAIDFDVEDGVNAHQACLSIVMNG